MLLGRFGLCGDLRNTVSSACYQILNDLKNKLRIQTRRFLITSRLKYFTAYYMVMAFITIIFEMFLIHPP